MMAVLRHELRGYFTNMTAYVFGSFLLLFAGIYTMVYNLANGLANFEYVMGSMSFVFLVIVPVLTMRVLAEERKQRTDLLLYSLPLSMTQVVLGKYLAMLAVFLVPMCIVALYPLVLSGYGTFYFAAAYGALLGYVFLGAALIAIGMFVSAITDSQAVAAGLCFVLMMVNYFIADLAAYVSVTAFASYLALALLVALAAFVYYRMTRVAAAAGVLLLAGEAVLLAAYVLFKDSFAGLFPAMMEQLSLFERFYAFPDGIFDLTALVYLATVAAVFVFLTVQAMEKRRWSE